MKNWLTRLKDIQFDQRTIPLAFLVVLLLAFGLLVPFLGFYQDDWHHVFFAHALGLPRLGDMFLYDGRPYAAPWYEAVFAVLSFNPVHWQIFTLALRFLTILFVWLFLRATWPQHQRQAAWVALLFAVYPLFKLQPLSVAYMLHWTGYLLFAISMWAMVVSLRRPRGYLPFTLLAVGAGLLDLVFLEYFSGIELIRPFILWLLLSGEELAPRQRLLKTLRLWLPYLGIFIFFLVYRIFLIPAPEGGVTRNAPVVLFNLFKDTLPTVIELTQRALQDVLYVVINTWSFAFNPELIDFGRPFNLGALLLAILLGAGLFFYLRHLHPETDEPSPTVRPWHRSALWIGLILTVLGPLPGWLINKSAGQNINLFHDRYAMASMIGASMVCIALLEWLVRDIRRQTLFLAVIIAWATGAQILAVNDYRWGWTAQTRFYQELYWRAPFIEPNTILFSDKEFLPLMGQLAVGYALGNLYPKLDQQISVNYWFISLEDQYNDRRADLVKGFKLNYSKNFGRFNGDTANSLLFYYAPEKGQCLWVLTPEEASFKDLPEIIQDVGSIANPSRIKASAPVPSSYPAEIFGPQTAPNWCYYYQKGDLARQYQQWDQVTGLWKQAQQNGFSPQNGFELLPFIEGYAFSGNWEKAGQLARQANKMTPHLAPVLCTAWQRFAAQTIDSAERDQQTTQLRSNLECSP